MTKIIFTPNCKAAEDEIRKAVEAGEDFNLISNPNKLFKDFEPIEAPIIVESEDSSS